MSSSFEDALTKCYGVFKWVFLWIIFHTVCLWNVFVVPTYLRSAVSYISTLSFPFCSTKASFFWPHKSKHSYAETLSPKNTVQHIGSPFSQMCNTIQRSGFLPVLIRSQGLIPQKNLNLEVTKLPPQGMEGKWADISAAAAAASAGLFSAAWTPQIHNPRLSLISLFSRLRFKKNAGVTLWQMSKSKMSWTAASSSR